MDETQTMVRMNFVRCIDNSGYEGSLDIDQIYQSLPTTQQAQKAGDLRIIDNEGEDYLYSQARFEPVRTDKLLTTHSFSATAHLNGISAILMRDQARARGISMSALLREWVAERLDLPELA